MKFDLTKKVLTADEFRWVTNCAQSLPLQLYQMINLFNMVWNGISLDIAVQYMNSCMRVNNEPYVVLL